MKWSAGCPSCGGRLSFWAAFKAPTPFRIRCPRCKVKLAVALPYLWAITLGVILILFAYALWSYVIFKRYGWIPFLVSYLGIFPLWFLIEFFTALLFFNRARFVAPPGKAAPPVAPPAASPAVPPAGPGGSEKG